MCFSLFSLFSLFCFIPLIWRWSFFHMLQYIIVVIRILYHSALIFNQMIFFMGKLWFFEKVTFKNYVFVCSNVSNVHCKLYIIIYKWSSTALYPRLQIWYTSPDLKLICIENGKVSLWILCTSVFLRTIPDVTLQR